MSTESTERAGAKIYKDILSFYRGCHEGAQHTMHRYACAYADGKRAEDHEMYVAARAQVSVWDQAISKLTSNAGDLMRLDFPK
jgi:hypothetical protein